VQVTELIDNIDIEGVIIIIIMDLYSTFRSEDTEALSCVKFILTALILLIAINSLML